VLSAQARVGTITSGARKEDVEVARAQLEAARARLRGDLIPYFSLPFYRAMLERSGFGEDISAFDSAMQSGDVGGAKAGISDHFLDLLTAIGSEDEVRAGVERYAEAGTTSPCIGPVPRTDFEATLVAAAL
jgi:alkanesulfonate monooxygenase SsuD/methylene tetrahydromethanopterin reductase-like flavin-dependent oxidoreductase (luciferase family)